MQQLKLINDHNRATVTWLSQQLAPVMGDFNVMSSMISAVLPYMPNAVVDCGLGWWMLSTVSYLAQFVGGRYVRSMACRTAWASRHLVESEQEEDLLCECLLSEDKQYLPRQASALIRPGLAGYRAACRLAYYAHKHGHRDYLRKAIKRLTVYDEDVAKAAGNPLAEYNLAIARYELLTTGKTDLERCIRLVASLEPAERRIYAIELCSFAPITSREIGIMMANGENTIDMQPGAPWLTPEE
ncbi:hypothetical protein JW859_09845 [bacterium]|nr:hypothetical protein [bacterium]